MGETINGRVVGVADGDTVTVLDVQRRQHQVRLAAIGVPEKRQDFGTRSKQSLSDLAYGRQANVESSKLDRYGRSLGKVTVDGIDANLEQVRRGMAWHYKVYERAQSPGDRLAYAAAENAARASRRGLRGMPSPVPPWNFGGRKIRARARSDAVTRSLAVGFTKTVSTCPWQPTRVPC